MLDSYLRQSPLAHVHLDAGTSNANSIAGISMSEIPHRAQFVLRGPSSDKTFLSVVENTLSVPLPVAPCQSSGSTDAVLILWMGPDEWLVVLPENHNTKLWHKLTSALADQHASTADVSDSRTTIRLSGENARETLTKGCSIDLHPRAFSTGTVVNTLLAQAHVTLHQIEDDAPNSCTYDIFVHRSFAEYLWSWLEDAVSEYK